MKKLYIFALVAMLFAACTTDAIDEQSVKVEEQTPDTLVGTFEGDDSRIQLQNGKTVWTKGDEVSVFYLSNANQKWQYQGDTGERTGNLKRVANAETTQEMPSIVVVYPYNENYYINPRTCNVKAFLPAEQTYLKDSYGLNGNIMISQSEYNQFSLKNVCGWLKVQLNGEGQVVRTITLKGNNGEQVAGEIYINSADATATLANEIGNADDAENGAGGNLVFDDTILTEVTLNCGEGVELGAEPTAFYIALPPQTFSKGISLEIVAADSSKMTKSTENEVVIERNHILPMAELVYDGIRPQPNNEIWYTATAKVEAANNSFNATIISNEWNETTGKGVIVFDQDVNLFGDSAFYGCTSLISMSIPNSVTSFGVVPFYLCSNLRSVTIPKGITSFETPIFGECNNLKEVYYQGSLSDWCKVSFFGAGGNPCYYGAKLYLAGNELAEVIAIPSDITEIRDYTFYNCSSLTSVTIPDSVTSIGNSAFEGCTSLTSVTIPNSITSIGVGAFGSCTSLTSVTIPNSITEIGDNAFANCSSLTSVTIPDSVTSIGRSAFYGCSRLTSITIPDSVTSIGGMAFWNCSSLTSVCISDLSAWCKISYSSMQSNPCCNGAKLYLKGNELAEITIPSDITEIKDSAFYGCISITKVDVSDSVTEIGSRAFYNCSSLMSITIPNSVSSIGMYTFYNCNSLASITIPSSITSIGNSAFEGCSGLQSVYISDLSAWCRIDFSEYGSGNPMTFNGGRLYLNNTEITELTIPSDITEIKSGTFAGCTAITKVKMHDNITSIGYNAFSSCSSLTSVTIPNSVTSIGFEAFYWCSSLTSITIPDSVTSIGVAAFYNCSSLTSVTIPDSVTSIGGDAFGECTSLTEVYCKPTTPPTVGYYVFSYYDSGYKPIGCKIYVPTESVEAYKVAEYWSDYAVSIVGYDF